MKDPAFLFYSQDFLVGTYEMTDAQVGQYIRLLCLQHAKGHLKESLMIATMGGSLDEAVASKFVVDENGLYFNERLDTEADRRRKYSESRSRNRSSRSEESQEEDTGTHEEDAKSQDDDVSIICESHDSHMETETITTNKIPNLDKTVPKKGVTGGNKKKKQNNTGLSAEDFNRFTDFWDTYPKKVAKATAIAAFKKLAPDESLMADILIAIEKQKKSAEWIDDGGKYIPHPSTWLNQKRWEDQLTEVTNGQSGTGSGVHQSARTPAESRFAKFGDPI